MTHISKMLVFGHNSLSIVNNLGDFNITSSFVAQGQLITEMPISNIVDNGIDHQRPLGAHIVLKPNPLFQTASHFESKKSDWI